MVATSPVAERRAAPPSSRSRRRRRTPSARAAARRRSAGLGGDAVGVERRIARVTDHDERHAGLDRGRERRQVGPLDLRRACARSSPARRPCSRSRRPGRGSAWRSPPRRPRASPAPRRPSRSPAASGSLANSRPASAAPPTEGTSPTGARLTVMPSVAQRARRRPRRRRPRSPPPPAPARTRPAAPTARSGSRRPPGRRRRSAAAGPAQPPCERAQLRQSTTLSRNRIAPAARRSRSTS